MVVNWLSVCISCANIVRLLIFLTFRSSILPRDKPSSSEHIQKQKCIICGKSSHQNEREKFRISESPCAKNFLEATLYKQDEVYIRVAYLESESRVFGADLFYHKICLPNYLNKYNRKLEGCKIRKKSKKREIFVKELESIEEMIDRGFFIPISEIRNVINDKCDEELMSNKEIKLYLSEFFTDRVQFCKSDRRNESMMVYSSKLTMQDVAQKLSAMNSVKDTAHAIRVALKMLISNSRVNFVMPRKWNHRGKICNCQTVCYYSFPPCSIFHNLLWCKVLWRQTRQTMETRALSKMMILVSKSSLIRWIRKNWTALEKLLKSCPFFKPCIMSCIIVERKYHCMSWVDTPYTIHVKVRSSTSLNRIAACISYSEVRRDRSNLAQYSFLKSEENVVPIPSHFVKEKFTFAAFDNFDSSDRSSPTETMSNHDTVSVLFQIKPDELPSKPLMSTVAMKKDKSEGFKQYPCQNLRTYNRQSKILLLPPS